MSDSPTPTPWKLEPAGRDWHVCGDYHESEEEDHDEGGFAVAETQTVCVRVATVHGNETSGTIADANARLIVRSVNAHDALIAVVERLVRIANIPRPSEQAIALDRLESEAKKALVLVKGENP